ncbi:hypothetical protein PTTG_07379 [Puccinia triticina 1-1 BBBD Race 1]|uniref:Uncharacterized protein n=1 Tax=Puccinia triticina (isolate 1-1 / race 1 (BBBD)) TaxID=630390 RepID=A0A180H692_PUCT1|nr:hypothetical protein PTTG_07379 [Puccinia triticina 1-1 BBBD Race 1]
MLTTPSLSQRQTRKTYFGPSPVPTTSRRSTNAKASRGVGQDLATPCEAKARCMDREAGNDTTKMLGTRLGEANAAIARQQSEIKHLGDLIQTQTIQSQGEIKSLLDGDAQKTIEIEKLESRIGSIQASRQPSYPQLAHVHAENQTLQKVVAQHTAEIQGLRRIYHTPPRPNQADPQLLSLQAENRGLKNTIAEYGTEIHRLRSRVSSMQHQIPTQPYPSQPQPKPTPQTYYPNQPHPQPTQMYNPPQRPPGLVAPEPPVTYVQSLPGSAYGPLSQPGPPFDSTQPGPPTGQLGLAYGPFSHPGHQQPSGPLASSGQLQGPSLTTASPAQPNPPWPHG